MAINTFNPGGTRGGVCRSLVMVDADGATVLDFVDIFNSNSGTMTQDTGASPPGIATIASAGKAFQLARIASTFDVYGYTFTDPVTFSSASGNWESLFIAFVMTSAAVGNALLQAQSSSTQGNFPGVGFAASVGSGVEPFLATGSTNLLASGTTLVTTFFHTVGISFTYGGATGIYIDGGTANGGSQATGTDSGHGSIGQSIGRIGNVNGQGYIGIQIFAWAYFHDTTATSPLSQSDFAALHNSITGSGAFSLINTSVNTPITPGVGALTQSGNAPTATPATSTVLTPAVARRVEFVRRDSGVLMPIERRIILPARRVA
jgi:hypothetical protein